MKRIWQILSFGYPIIILAMHRSGISSLYFVLVSLIFIAVFYWRHRSLVSQRIEFILANIVLVLSIVGLLLWHPVGLERLFPLVISLFATLFFWSEWLGKRDNFVAMVGKFRRLTDRGAEALRKTLPMWSILTAINSGVFAFFLFRGPTKFWVMYATIGSYLLIGLGILTSILYVEIRMRKDRIA